MLVKFTGNPKKLAVIVIEAVTGEVADYDRISCGHDVSVWRGKPVRWFCVPCDDGRYMLKYPNGYADWPGIVSAEALCRKAGVEWELC